MLLTVIQQKNVLISKSNQISNRGMFFFNIFIHSSFFSRGKKRFTFMYPSPLKYAHAPETGVIFTRCTKKSLPFLQYNPRFPLCPNANFYMYQKHVTPECLRWSTNGSDSVTLCLLQESLGKTLADGKATLLIFKYFFLSMN